MEKETVFQYFDNLEAKIEHLVENCRRLEAENRRLRDQAVELERQLAEKQLAEQQLQELKTSIRDRIDSLMSRLTEFGTEA